jgi:EAL domain-containing protein (putative c-di-GMP-specific phosphodiesterase class I)
VALDDAGAGQSTRERLLLLQPAYLKIDRPVVLAWARGEPRELLYWVRWGRELGARVVAEGVEDAGLASALRLVGVTHVQGYAFGRPEPGDYWTAERLERVRPA